MSFEHKVKTLSNNKEVHIFDGLVPLNLRTKVLSYVSNSMFKLGWPDAAHEEALKHKYLHSSFTNEETAACGLLPYLIDTEVFDLIRGLELKKSVVNLSVPTDCHFPHAHEEKKVVLYYPNETWETHWYGETLFYSEDLKEIDLAIKYTPGRIVVFDGDTPHSVRPQSSAAHTHRYTYAMIFN